MLMMLTLDPHMNNSISKPIFIPISPTVEAFFSHNPHLSQSCNAYAIVYYSGDDSCTMSTVAVIVHRICIVVSPVVAEWNIVHGKVRVVPVDSRVNNSHKNGWTPYSGVPSPISLYLYAKSFQSSVNLRFQSSSEDEHLEEFS